MRTKTRENAFAAGGGGRIALLIVTAGMLIESMIPGNALAECTPTPTPISESCPTSSTACPFPTPTATPVDRPPDVTPTVTPTPSYYQGSKFLEAQFASFGNRWSQRPQTDLASTFQFVWGIPMTYNTRTMGSGSTVPSIYSPLVSQAIYWDDLWDSGFQEFDFAHRTQHFLGSFASSAINFYSGPDLTRNATADSEKDQKYAIGEVHLGMALRGGAWKKDDLKKQDQWNVLGSANFGMASIADHDTFEGEGHNQNWQRRVYLNQITGSENAAWLGRVLGPKLNDTDKPGSIDLREGYWHEDSAVNLVPADVGAMFGTSNLVFLDNKRGGYCSERPLDNPKTGGYIGLALANRAYVCAFTQGSWVNTGDTVSYEGGLLVVNPFSGDEGWYCGTNGERPGSTIRSYTGINIFAPAIDPCDPIDLRTARAFSFYDFAPEEGGGAAPLVAGNVDESYRNMSVEPEKYGSFIRGSMVVGDAHSGRTADSGYDTDVLHVRDVVHLTPRTQPPRFDENLPPSERVGLLYFDLARNTLRVSVAAENPALSETGDWKSAEVVWVDLALNVEDVSPVIDVAGAEASANSLAYKSIDNVKDSIELAKVSAQNGNSAYLHPSIEIAGPVMLDASTASFTLLYSGFGEESPNLYWRMRSVEGKQQVVETHWVRLSEMEVTPVEGLDESSGAAVVLITPETTDDEGNAVPIECSGKLLQLFAINRTTGQSSGTSVRL